jgi:hypothetical protein
MRNHAEVVMKVLTEFGTAENYRVRLTKIGCVEGHEPKIPIGQIIEGELTSKVEVGLSFNIKNAVMSDGSKWMYWYTSIIQKVLTDNTFETKNSIYKWEKI